LGREQSPDHFLALGRNLFGTALEFVPDFTIQATGPRLASNSPCAQDRIEGREIAQLHGQAARRAAKLLCNLNDHWIPSVELPEREFSMKVYRDQ
jgi:hypothetical protein